MLDRYLGPDEDAQSVEDDAPSRMAARLVVTEDFEESRQQEHAAADQQMAVQATLQEAR